MFNSIPAHRRVSSSCSSRKRDRGRKGRVPEQHWVMTEAWWAERVRPPAFGDMAEWLGPRGAIRRIVGAMLPRRRNEHDPRLRPAVQVEPLVIGVEKERPVLDATRRRWDRLRGRDPATQSEPGTKRVVKEPGEVGKVYSDRRLITRADRRCRVGPRVRHRNLVGVAGCRALFPGDLGAHPGVVRRPEVDREDPADRTAQERGAHPPDRSVRPRVVRRRLRPPAGPGTGRERPRQADRGPPRPRGEPLLAGDRRRPFGRRDRELHDARRSGPEGAQGRSADHAGRGPEPRLAPDRRRGRQGRRRDQAPVRPSLQRCVQGPARTCCGTTSGHRRTRHPSASSRPRPTSSTRDRSARSAATRSGTASPSARTTAPTGTTTRNF